MFFTQEDYRKIEKRLLANSRKDTDFVGAATPFKGNETVVLVQDGKNVKASIKDVVKQLFLLGVSDFVNITDKYGESYISLSQAIELIPYKSRKIGQVVTFLDDTGKWAIFQFQGTRKNQWGTLSLWVDLIDLMTGLTITDSEDIVTETNSANQVALKFANKNYNTADYSGLGRVYLRKNIVNIEDPVTGNIVEMNYLTQSMISKENTIYIIQYDYSLNRQTISIPEGSVLLFEGGSINDGTITCNSTTIIGKFGGNATIAGTYSFQDAQADEEDITQSQSSILKFKDKGYDEANFSGLGRIYLRKNIVNGVNILTQGMINNPNTIYHIQYDYDLNGATINIPEGCVLLFEGGSISNGTINNLSSIIDDIGIFNSISFTNSHFTPYIKPELFKGEDDTQLINSAISCCKDTNSNLEFSGRTYTVQGTFDLESIKIIKGNSSTIRLTTDSILFRLPSTIKVYNLTVNCIGGTSISTAFYTENELSNSEFKGVNITNFKYGFLIRFSLWCIWENIRCWGCLCGFRFARNNDMTNQSNPEAINYWNYSNGWYHNQNILKDILCNGGEVGIFGSLVSSTLDTVTVQNQRSDSTNNKILPIGVEGTGILLEGGESRSTDKIKTIVLQNIYVEGTKRPLVFRFCSVASLDSLFVQGSTTANPYESIVTLESSNVYGTAINVQDYFKYIATLTNSKLYGSFSTLFTVSEILKDSLSSYYKNKGLDNNSIKYTYTIPANSQGKTAVITMPTDNSDCIVSIQTIEDGINFSTTSLFWSFYNWGTTRGLISNLNNNSPDYKAFTIQSGEGKIYLTVNSELALVGNIKIYKMSDTINVSSPINFDTTAFTPVDQVNITSGDLSKLPTLNVKTGYSYFNVTDNKPMYYKSSGVWVDSNGFTYGENNCDGTLVSKVVII